MRRTNELSSSNQMKLAFLFSSQPLQFEIIIYKNKKKNEIDGTWECKFMKQKKTQLNREAVRGRNRKEPGKKKRTTIIRK